MTSERWRKIEELYHAAQACDPTDCGALLAEACQGDDELRRQVEALLAQDTGGRILDGPAAELLSGTTELTNARALSAGDQLGPYEIVSHIGAGGMGEVYKAQDSRLRRSVALKVLPPEVRGDPARRQRFERETRAVAALNHPNIVSIHDVGEDQGVYFMVTELVDGEPLGAAHLDLRKTLDIAVQIASGLAAAHQAGIIHRDLKPANILLTRDGRVKILDFGLAKLGGPASDSNTQPGMVMGTPSYMSPEQVKAEPTDYRSDIFSFGVILYELLSGHRAFQGLTAEVMAAILNTDPPELPETVPSSLRKIVAHCLEKDPAKRFQSAGDLEFALAALAQGSPSAPAGRSRSNWAWIAAAVVSLIAAVFGFAHFTRRTPETAAVRFSFTPAFKADAIDVAVSPDGTRIAFADANGGSALWLRSIDSLTARELPGTEGAACPFWSPDGHSAGFITYDGIKKVDFSGGQSAVQSVTSLGGYWGGGAWNQQGVILFLPDPTGSGLYRVPASGGTPSPATRLNSARREISHRYPQFLPDGRHFIYWVWSELEENTGEYVGSLDPGEKPMDGPLVRTWREVRYSDPGYLLFLRGSTLMAGSFDPVRLRLTGEPRPLPEHIGMHPFYTGQALFSTSATGTMAYQEALAQPGARVVLRGRKGNQLRTIEAPPGSGSPSLDPTERNVAVFRDDENSLEDLWRVDLERGVSSRLTAGHGSNQKPIWSPDGKRIAFQSNRLGAYDLYIKNADGSGDEELLVKSSHTKFPTGWSMDGRFLAYFELDPVTSEDIWVLPLQGDRKPIPFLKTGFSEADGKLAPVPDSQGHLWMAHSSNETGSYEVYLRPFLPNAPGGAAGAKVRVSTGGGAQPIWRKDGRELFYLEGNKLMAVDVKLGGETPEIGVPHKLFDAPSSDYTAFGDGQRFLFIEPAGESPSPRINVVLNWAAGLQR